MERFEERVKIEDSFLLSKTEHFKAFDKETYDYAVKVIGEKDSLKLEDVERVLNDIPYKYYYEIRSIDEGKYHIVIWKIEEVEDDKY